MVIPLRVFSSPLHLLLIWSPPYFNKSQKETALIPLSVCCSVSFLPSTFFATSLWWTPNYRVKISWVYWVSIMQINCCCCLPLNACKGTSPGPPRCPPAVRLQTSKVSPIPGRAPEGSNSPRLSFQRRRKMNSNPKIFEEMVLCRQTDRGEESREAPSGIRKRSGWKVCSRGAQPS